MRLLPGRLTDVLRPAASGPVRYWQERVRLVVKGTIAAVAAWALAKYVAGQADPYFAPLAALFGVYPTVARSLREAVQYVAGFLLGAALAIPVGMLVGPGTAGIAIIVLAGMLISSWRRLGDQNAQVIFTALFALLLGGHQPFNYVMHRGAEVAIGIVTGLVVNVVIFPPLQLRPAECAMRVWGEDIAAAFDALAEAARNPEAARRSWPRHDRQLTVAAEQARAAARNARDSLRWNPRARLRPSVRPPDGAVVESLEALTARIRAVARSLLAPANTEPAQLPACFADLYSRFLRLVGAAVRQLADSRSDLPEPSEAQSAAVGLDHAAAQVPADSPQRPTVRQLCVLAREMTRELSAASS